MASSSLSPIGAFGMIAVVVVFGLMVFAKGFSETESVPILQEISPYLVFFALAVAFITVVVVVKKSP